MAVCPRNRSWVWRTCPLSTPAIVTLGLARNRYNASRSATEARLVGEAFARVQCRQRHNALQALVKPRIAQRIALEFRGDITHLTRAGFAHDPIRSQVLDERH
jgi:hypothetical protein